MIKTKETSKSGLSVLAGLIGYATSGSLGLYLLKTFWVEYAKSSVDKSYTFEMLLSRLFVGFVAAVTASILTTKTSKQPWKTSWIVGIIVFSVAAYIHFIRVWTDYPIWYHFSYLLLIIPIIKLTSYYLTKKD